MKSIIQAAIVAVALLSNSPTPQLLRATGKFVLKQTDFGITPYSAAAGSITVKNEVVVSFNMVAR